MEQKVRRVGGMVKMTKSAIPVAGEHVSLQTVPGTGNMTGAHAFSSGPVRDYRRLAIGSIICGISCIGIYALINSVKAWERRESDPENAEIYSNKARKWSFFAIAAWVGLLILIPVLMALVSYLLTLICLH
ncbi:hypothetical protein JZ751_026388 [Albula glossodonta]|uniref:Transmembrane protein 265 n=1 Tax=Albula glossodonta TaxID=121402 RepID=A0A8T2PBY6_9TELE|nr:hypothetical protein JZ751_026388 [Albula glossodonta]